VVRSSEEAAAGTALGSAAVAPEITTARWPAKDTGGHSPAHSRHEHRELWGAPRIHGELLPSGDVVALKMRPMTIPSVLMTVERIAAKIVAVQLN
jgi:hypothetical protein